MSIHVLSRRGVLGLLASLANLIGVGGMAAAQDTAVAQQKVSQAVAKYQNRPKGGQRCSICINFRPPKECQYVVGPIVPQGWCEFFAGRENAH